MKPFNTQQRMPDLCPLPVVEQFSLVQFGPGLDQAELSSRQHTCQLSNRIDAERCLMLTIARMEMGQMMRFIQFHVQGYHNAKKSGYFGHSSSFNRQVDRSRIQIDAAI